MTRTAALLAAALLAAATLAASPAFAQEMRPGQYRTVTKVEMAGRTMPPSQEESCVTKADIDEGLARMGQDKDTKCKPSDVKRGPGTVSYKVACTDEGVKSTGEANVKMTPDGFDFTLAMKNPEMGPMKVNVRGTRVGDCRK